MKRTLADTFTSATTATSTIRFTTFALYRNVGKRGQTNSFVEVLHGASAGRFGDDGRVELLAGSAPFNTLAYEKLAPKDGEGLLMLYGHRDALDELQAWRRKARDLDAEMAWATVEVAVGHMETNLIDRASMKAAAGTLRFANVRRMKASLQIDILERFAGYVSAEGGNADSKMSRPVQMATRPDLFVRALEDDADLRALDALVIPVADDPEVPGRIRQVALVRPSAQVVEVRQGSSEASILLPQWMTGRPKLRSAA